MVSTAPANNLCGWALLPPSQIRGSVMRIGLLSGNVPKAPDCLDPGREVEGNVLSLKCPMPNSAVVQCHWRLLCLVYISGFLKNSLILFF